MFNLFLKFCLLSPLTIILFCGCTSITSQSAVEALRINRPGQAMVWANKLKDSKYSSNLGALEKGRIEMFNGNFNDSSKNFSFVIEKLIYDSVEGPVIKTSDLVDQSSATIIDDRLRKKTIAPYEFIQALNYLILSDIFLGKIPEACVEARRSIYAQNTIADKYAKEINEINDHNSKLNSKAASYTKKANQDLFQNASAILERTTSSYENGLTWFLCGVLLESQEDLGNAALSYRKAYELAPKNTYATHDFLRLLQTQDLQKYEQMLQVTGADPNLLINNPTEIIIVFEESFVSQRIAEKYSIGIASYDVPIYKDGPYNPVCTTVFCDSKNIGRCQTINDIQALAYHDLKEQMTGIIFRNSARALIKIGAQTGAYYASPYASLGVLIGNIIWTALNKADTRSWITLPMVSKIYRAPIAPGSHNISVVSGSTHTINIPINLAAGEKRLIWIVDLGGVAHWASAPLGNKGQKPNFNSVIFN